VDNKVFAAFVAALPDGASADDASRQALARAIERARGAWPDLSVDEGAFAAHLGKHLGDGDLDDMRVEDVLLAWASARGDERAIAAFEARCFPDVAPILARLLRNTAASDEIEQRLRERLFVGGDERAPAALDYGGRGELRNWVRVTIARTALNMATRGPKETPAEDDLFAALPDAAEDPEVSNLRAQCREEFRESFLIAARSLTPRERNLLRHAFVDGLGIDAIGSLYGVHRATAARWLAAARATLMTALQRDLSSRLALQGDEVKSLLRWAQSQVDVSLERCLGTTP
jgi:RNA polymerase sigma-70 factor (ECF subfamily)